MEEKPQSVFELTEKNKNAYDWPLIIFIVTNFVLNMVAYIKTSNEEHSEFAGKYSYFMKESIICFKCMN